MNRNDALRSLAPGCIACPQMASVGSGQGVQNSMRGKIHRERHFSQLSRAPQPTRAEPTGTPHKLPTTSPAPRLEQKPHSCLHAATCGSHVSGSRLAAASQVFSFPGLLLPSSLSRPVCVQPGGGVSYPSVTDLVIGPGWPCSGSRC